MMSQGPISKTTPQLVTRTWDKRYRKEYGHSQGDCRNNAAENVWQTIGSESERMAIDKQAKLIHDIT